MNQNNTGILLSMAVLLVGFYVVVRAGIFILTGKLKSRGLTRESQPELFWKYIKSQLFLGVGLMAFGGVFWYFLY